MKKVAVILAVIAALSMALNIYLTAAPRGSQYVAVTNANSRPTYFAIHNIPAAHLHATGRGVKIGIIDHYFGFDMNRALYAGGVDFLDDGKAFREIGEHGLWLTRTAKEIAPDAQIYALNATSPDEAQKVEAMAKAIAWAAEHDLDVITYSGRAFSPRYRPQIDAAVEKATAAGVSCVFIHYPHPSNLLPFPMLGREAEPGYARDPDINVYHYDYNTLLLRDYEKFAKGKGGTPPYLSLSSTSVVAAGVLALMREVNNTLSPEVYKGILVETSHAYEEKKQPGPEIIRSCPRVIDAAAAVGYMEVHHPLK